MRYLVGQLLTSKEGFNKKNLSQLSLAEIQAFCLLFNTSKSGTKKEVIKRLLKVYAVRVVVARTDEPEELKSKFKRRVLVKLCTMAGVWKGGNKFSLSAGLINWRNNSRRKAERLLDDLKRNIDGELRQRSFKFGERGELVKGEATASP